MKTKTKGEMEIGTLIIFIAVILVAAIVAALLISTAQQLQEQRTMNDNTQSSPSTYEPYNSSSTQESLPPEPPGLP